MKSLVALSTITSSVDVWHRRLGHPSHKSLAHLISKFDFPTTNKHSVTSSCESCQQGEHVRLPFSNSVSFTYFPFQLIHCDIWISLAESFTGYKYYLIVIDDFSHYTWTFPIRHKSDACNQLIDFYSFALNQFHLSIQCVQCDNGREFDNNVLRSFLSSKGVVLRLSCPHTSSQNGKAERGIRSINDITRTLLFQANLKPRYWVEAVQTATYLINRRPCKPINLLTPYEVLFLQQPDYQHLRSFGCLCYPNLSAIATNKLAPRTTRCIFIGYPKEHKGYRCLDLDTHKIITSRHVVFDESNFPLHKIVSSGMQGFTNRASIDHAHSGWDLVPVRSTTCRMNPHHAAETASQVLTPTSPHTPRSEAVTPDHSAHKLTTSITACSQQNLKTPTNTCTHESASHNTTRPQPNPTQPNPTHPIPLLLHLSKNSLNTKSKHHRITCTPDLKVG
jgi:hypothetical protein